jgi:hypothetical protein
MSGRKTLPSTINATFLPGSADGVLRSGSQAGPTIGPSGPVAAPASRSASPDPGEVSKTSATSGPSSLSSSASADLQRSLASRLRQRLEGIGSPLYALTWKEWPMQSGPPICALRASARRTSDSGCSGSPMWVQLGWSLEAPMWCLLHGMEAGDCECPDVDLCDHDPYSSGGPPMEGWPTPHARDWKDSPGMSTTGVNPDGSERVRLDRSTMLTFGVEWPPWSPVMDAPDLYRWMMGYPPEWSATAGISRQALLI